VKKSLAAISMTAAVILISFLLSGISHPTSAYAVTAVKSTAITSRLLCRGVIAQASSEYIFPDHSCKTLEVYVRPGDIVAAGDRLFLVETLAPAVLDNVAVFSALSSAVNDDNLPISEEYARDILASLLPSRNTQSTVQPAEKMYITAPMDGVVAKIFSAKNFYASPALPLAEILDVSSLIVKAEIPEAYASLIRPGQRAQITGDGFPGVTLKGTVLSIMPFATQKGSIISQGETVMEAVISIDVPPDEVKPGLNANVWVTADHKDNALTIPYEAIYADENGREFVYKLAGGRVVKSAVTTGYDLEDSTEAVSGVDAGDVLLLYPDSSIEKGGPIKISE